MSILRIQCYCRTGFDGGREAKVVRELLFDASARFRDCKKFELSDNAGKLKRL